MATPTTGEGATPEQDEQNQNNSTDPSQQTGQGDPGTGTQKDGQQEVQNPQAVLKALNEEREARKRLEKQISGLKGSKTREQQTLEERIAELETANQQAERAAYVASVRAAATTAGIVNAELVERLVENTDATPEEAVAQIKQNYPELFQDQTQQKTSNYGAGQGRGNAPTAKPFGQILADKVAGR